MIEINPHGITGANRAWESAIDHARLLPLTQVFWTEERNMPGVKNDGRVVSKIRSYKLARAYSNILLTYISSDEVAMAECLAFNQTIGFAGVHPLPAKMVRYIEFYRKNRDLFHETKDIADVAVIRSYPSITYNHSYCQLSAILAEQALIEARVPFRLIFDADLADLSPYRVVILPDSECLRDAQLASIRRFVESGGGLVVVGAAGWYDQWRRLRVQPGLAGLVDRQAVPGAYEENVKQEQLTGELQRKQVGRGRVFYLPALKFDGPLPEFGLYFDVDERFWKNPANAKDFLDGLAWAAQRDPILSISGPNYLVANAVEQNARRRIAIHLVNYNAHRNPIDNIAVTCRAAGDLRVQSCRLPAPEQSDPVDLTLQGQSHGVAFNIPHLNTYGIISLQLA